ncbi:MAG: phospholipid carrier-dependent glycosyltransferase, partial [Fimbriimonadaceae bacterium]|nr:phospholipid carrier-dependent glycosyltransferase [Fimbriimonadaceae bacterium]
MAGSSFLDRIDRSAALWALLVFAVAFGFRLFGVGWALPNADRWWSLHPDEPVNIRAARAVDPASLSFTPGFYNYGTLYLTLSKVAGSVGEAYAGRAEGMPEPVARDRGFLLGARILGCLAGAGLAVLVFLILLPRSNLVGAGFGAAFAAFAPGLVVHSRFATVDVPAAFFLVLSLYWAFRLIPPECSPEPTGPEYLRFAAWSGLAAGASAACKYSGILVLAGLAVVVLARRTERSWQALGIGF